MINDVIQRQIVNENTKVNYEKHKEERFINKHTLIMLLLFVISCVHNIALVVWTLLMPIYLIYRYKEYGAVEFFIYLQFRSLLSNGIAVAFVGTASLIKWAAIFLVSFYLLFFDGGKTDKKIKEINFFLFLFSVYSIFSAWIKSSYPLIATFKILSYSIPFAAILRGVSRTKDERWINEIVGVLGILLILGVPLLGSNIGYLLNGRSFQGVFNHPNLYGVMVAVFVGAYLYKAKRISMRVIIITSACILLLYPSSSRTGMISLILAFFIFTINQEMKLSHKIVIIVLLGMLIIFLFFLDKGLVSTVIKYLQKGNSDDILFSRSRQIENNLNRFLLSPLLGTGFNVPYDPNIRSYAFSFNLITENGNLFLALLGDVGIIGTVLFFCLYGWIFVLGHFKGAVIFFIPFLLSMGEMAFFSTNNFAVIFYILFAIYLSNGSNLNRIP